MTDAAGRRNLPKTYNPQAVEGPTYRRWLEMGAFRADAGSRRPHFSIALPPPNVTGSLHIGHALDHAGIATQNVVERELARQGRTRFDLGREAFVERVWAWKASSGGMILGQMQRLGDSVDWSRERFTMDEGLSRAVREVFVSLYEQGLLYRGQRIINWCPRCLTALSDIEVEHEEVPGELAYLRYPLADGSGALVVATSRAETMLGDTGVAVHPDDPRYRDMIGRTVRLPLVDREIPVVADAAVDREFGTGAVKVTPAHAPNDYEIAQRHGLEAVNILTEEAVVNANGGRFEGLDRYAAREAVEQALAAEGLLEKVTEAPHAVGHCYRCKTEVEPRLSLQWFVATKPLAAEAMEAVRSGQTRFEPARYARTFFTWMEGIRDWCVSRQLWWGHRIPAWYCPNGHVTVARQDPSACAECGATELRQDDDVIDPLELMDRYGTDALRFALIRGANPGSDVPLATEWVEGARNFANKLWNLGRFVLSSVPEGTKPEDLPAVDQRSLSDRWLLSRLERTRAAVTAAYDAYDPAEAARLLHSFAWSELADWAVELAKPRLAAGGEDARRAGAVLAYALDVTMRLLHPVMPFVTEELGRVLRDVDTITLGPWPVERPEDLDEAAEADMADLQEVIAAVRRFRAEHGVPPSRHPRLTIVPVGDHQAELLRAEGDSVRRLARLETVAVGPPSLGGGPTAKVLAAGAELHLPLAGMIDLDEELARLEREREALDAEARRAEAKLANADFVAKAPAAVVDKTRARLAEVEAARTKVVQRIQEVTATAGG